MSYVNLFLIFGFLENKKKSCSSPYTGFLRGLILLLESSVTSLCAPRRCESCLWARSLRPSAPLRRCGHRHHSGRRSSKHDHLLACASAATAAAPVATPTPNAAFCSHPGPAVLCSHVPVRPPLPRLSWLPPRARGPPLLARAGAPNASAVAVVTTPTPDAQLFAPTGQRACPRRGGRGCQQQLGIHSSPSPPVDDGGIRTLQTSQSGAAATSPEG
jgi:hypothetical protein